MDVHARASQHVSNHLDIIVLCSSGRLVSSTDPCSYCQCMGKTSMHSMKACNDRVNIYLCPNVLVNQDLVGQAAQQRASSTEALL